MSRTHFLVVAWLKSCCFAICWPRITLSSWWPLSGLLYLTVRSFLLVLLYFQTLLKLFWLANCPGWSVQVTNWKQNHGSNSSSISPVKGLQQELLQLILFVGWLQYKYFSQIQRLKSLRLTWWVTQLLMITSSRLAEWHPHSASSQGSRKDHPSGV